MSANIHWKIIHNQEEAQAELRRIGVDEESVPLMAPKMQFWVFKLSNVDVRAANILKQEMLSKGGEAAVAKWASGFSKPRTDVLLMGTLKQYRLLLNKLRRQPFGLKALAAELSEAVKGLKETKIIKWSCRAGELIIGGRTLIMGVLNVTPDSFSDAGRYLAAEKAVGRALEMVAAGADIIDIGGESSRPGADEVDPGAEQARVLPVIKSLRKTSMVPISIDTRNSRTAAAALEAGADIINDISALRHDAEMVSVAAAAKVPLIIMHMQGTPRTMQRAPHYDDLIAEITLFLRRQAAAAVTAGVTEANIAVDPGFGFGKTPAHNLEILKRLAEIKSLGRPLLIGTSRKSTIGKVLDLPVAERLLGTAATVAASILNGADIVRVHDVKAMLEIVKMTDAIKAGKEWHGEDNS